VKTRYGDGRYEVLRSLGRGATAEVLEVLDARLGARRALKRMVEPPSEEAARRQEREAAIMARLDHPGVVTVVDAFEEDGQRCVVMELCEGGSLATRVELEGPLSPERVVAIGQALHAALDVAHDNGVLHRDLKPQNILFGPAGDPRIADFGLSWVSQDDETLTRTGALMGSVPFMAPELRRGEPHTPATDRYALAATLAWSATGAFPPDLDRVGALDDLPDEVAVFLAGLMAGDARVPEARVLARRRHRSVARGVVGFLAVGAAGGAGWSLAPAPPVEPVEPGVLATYDALPPCEPAPAFAAWDKYPHYNTDPRLPEEAGGVALPDIDGDGDKDLVVIYTLGEAVDLFTNDAGSPFRRGEDGVFEAPWRDDADVAASTLTVGDIHGDGREDAVWLKRNRSGFQVLWTTPDGRPEIRTLALGDPTGTPVLVDTDGDGCDDLLFSTRSMTPAVRIRRSRCNGEFDVAGTLLEGWAGVGWDSGHLLAQHGDGRVARLDPVSRELSPIPRADGLPLVLRPGRGLVLDTVADGFLGLVGLAADGGVCRLPADKPLRGVSAVADLDGDGLPDRVTIMSCGYCTSQVLLDRGSATP